MPQRLAQAGAVGDRDRAGHDGFLVAAGLSSSSLVIALAGRMATTLANEACRSSRITGRTNRCREHASTITNAQTVTRFPAAGSGQRPAARNRSALRLPARPARPQHLDLRPARLLRHVRRHIPAEAGDAHRQPLLISQPLMDRGRRDPGLQLLADKLMMRPDRRPGHLPQPGIASSGNHSRANSAHRSSPTGAPADAGRLRGRGVLPYRLTVHPQALRDLAVVPPRLPVDQDLDDVNHVERSPRHRASRPERPG